MSGAIGLCLLIVVLGVFLPDVLRALETFLLTFLEKGTAMISAIQPPAAYAPLSR